MITTVTNFGGALGVRLPKSLLKKALISENDDVEIVAEHNCIIIKCRKNKKHLTTKERISAFYEAASDDAPASSEIDWGKPQGGEVW
jgi:antitoxin component of MazEF toxin-antitoxin module